MKAKMKVIPWNPILSRAGDTPRAFESTCISQKAKMKEKEAQVYVGADRGADC
jgi:hypothetical protein